MAVTRTDPRLLDDDRFRPGFGTYSLTGDRGVALVETALDVGYRHVDTARLYGNEREVGAALDRAAVAREDVLVATKVAHFEEPEKTPEYVRTAVEESRERLGVDTIDLLYHHWPRYDHEVETVLSVLDDLVEEGLAANVGVSNYPVRYLERAECLLDAPIAAAQVEMHPLLQQEELYAALRERDVPIVAYSPVAQGRVFDVHVLADIAEKHHTTPAAVSLAWLLQKPDVVPIPRTSDEAHVRDNFAARRLHLDAEDVARIESIDRTERLEDPDWMEW